MKINKLNITKNMKKKTAALALAGTLSLTALTGCGNQDMWDTNYTFTHAVIVINGNATILDIEKWCDYEGEQYQIITKDGSIINASSFNTFLFNDEDTTLSVEDFAYSLIGDEGNIYYYKEENKTKVK